MFVIVSTFYSSFNPTILPCLFDKLAVINDVLKKKEIAAKILFYKKEKSGCQVHKNLY